MTTSDKQLSTAPKLSEIAKIIDQAREGALAPTQAMKAIDWVLHRPEQSYQKPLG